MNNAINFLSLLATELLGELVDCCYVNAWDTVRENGEVETDERFLYWALSTSEMVGNDWLSSEWRYCDRVDCDIIKSEIVRKHTK